MITFEEAFYNPGNGCEILKYLYYHEAMLLKSVNNFCKDIVTKFEDRLIKVFSYNNGTLTFIKNKKPETFNNCMSISIIKKGKNNYILKIECYIYYRSFKFSHGLYDEYDDYTEPGYDKIITKYKINKISAINYIQAMKFMAHSIQKRCHQCNINEIKLDIQPLPEVEYEYEYDIINEYYNNINQNYFTV